MRVTLPTPLTHSWPLFEQQQRFDLGQVIDPIGSGWDLPTAPGALATQRIGLWECDLVDNALSWTDGVYDLFGLPRQAAIARDDTVAMYAEPSRSAMERLRAHAIRHRRGFTIDVEIAPATGGRRWLRLIAAPICYQSRAVRLHGIKQDVTAAYR